MECFATEVVSLEDPRRWSPEVHYVKLLYCENTELLTIVVRAHNGRVECRLNWNLYDITVNCKF